MVLGICHFKDMYPNLIVLLHLTCSDSCEVLFLKIGGMNGHERAYESHKLVNTANTLNHISIVEYMKDMLAFKNNIMRWRLYGKHLMTFTMERSDVICVIVH